MDSDITKEMLCPSCGAILPADAVFCLKCGAKLREVTVSTSVGKQTVIYLVSLFLAPFGLGYAFKYLKQSDPKAKEIGAVSLVLTILAIAFMIWIAKASVESYNNILKSLTI